MGGGQIELGLRINAAVHAIAIACETQRLETSIDPTGKLKLLDTDAGLKRLEALNQTRLKLRDYCDKHIGEIHDHEAKAVHEHLCELQASALDSVEKQLQPFIANKLLILKKQIEVAEPVARGYFHEPTFETLSADASSLDAYVVAIERTFKQVSPELYEDLQRELGSKGGDYELFTSRFSSSVPDVLVDHDMIRTSMKLIKDLKYAMILVELGVLMRDHANVDSVDLKRGVKNLTDRLSGAGRTQSDLSRYLQDAIGEINNYMSPSF